MNHQEEADFWDTHDLTDYWDQFQPVKVRFAKNLSSSITVRFDAKDIDALRAEGEKKGIGPTTLIRMWVKERLAALHDQTQRAEPSSKAKAAARKTTATRRRRTG
jgi:predicted DNA binding CopG/RHH family protein